jgi:predicted nuclease of predicted toxin-antitoxin system
LRFTADEGLDRQIVERLRSDGHEVLYVAELDPGIGDELVLEMATAAGALLLTADKDFGELIFRQRRASNGVCLIRLAGLDPLRKAEIVSVAIRGHGSQMAGAFTVISSTNVRIRFQT